MWSRVTEAYRRTRKPKDLLWNRYVARPLAAVIVVPLENTPITPNQVTLATLVIFAISSVVIALCPGRGPLLIGVVILEFAYVLDCVDGQLARLRGVSTPIGAHLDFLMDELKAFLLISAVGIRLWRADGRVVWLLEAILGLLAVASAISLTTFVRRPEYAAATGARVRAGLGDYGSGAGVAAAATATPPPSTSIVLLEKLGGFIVHYPSYILFVALLDRMDLFLHVYASINAAHAARSLLAIALKLGRPARPAA